MVKKKKVYDLIKKNEIGMMTNINEEGQLVSHPMTRQGDLKDDTLWFFSTRDSEKVRELIKNKSVNVSFSDDGFVSVSGQVEIVDDVSIKKELWSKSAEAFYDGKPEDYEVVLIKVKIESLEYWKSDNILKSAFELIKGMVSDEKPDMGENEAVEVK